MKLSKTIICVLITGAIALGAAAAILILTHTRHGEIARIYQDGVLIQTMDLSAITEPVEWTVTAADGGTNTILAEHGAISVISASCPDQVCVHTGKISGPLLPIACLPNGLLIRIENAAGPGGTGVDSISK